MAADPFGAQAPCEPAALAPHVTLWGCNTAQRCGSRELPIVLARSGAMGRTFVPISCGVPLHVVSHAGVHSRWRVARIGVCLERVHRLPAAWMGSGPLLLTLAAMGM